MARKSLSFQVMQEVDRVTELLVGAKGLMDPMSAHMIDTALRGLHTIETLCLGAQQRQVDDVLSRTPLAIAFGDAPASPEPKSRKTASAGRRRTSKASE